MLVCLSPNICELEYTLIDSTTPFCYQNKTDLGLVSEGILRRFGLAVRHPTTKCFVEA